MTDRVLVSCHLERCAALDRGHHSTALEIEAWFHIQRLRETVSAQVSVQGRISGATTGAEQGESPCRILVSKRCSMVEARQHPLIPLRAQVRAGNPIFSTGHTFGRVRHHISHAHMEIWRYGDREDRGRRHAAGCRSAEVLHTVHGVEPECASSRASAYAAARGVCVAAGNGGRGD